jgi:hypothetical protein
MSLYEIIITCVAFTNLLLTLGALHAARQKAATARLDLLETDVRAQLAAHADTLHKLQAAAEVAIDHSHLEAVYERLNGIAEQVHQMVGAQEQMNALLRQLLAQQLRH